MTSDKGLKWGFIDLCNGDLITVTVTVLLTSLYPGVGFYVQQEC